MAHSLGAFLATLRSSQIPVVQARGVVVAELVVESAALNELDTQLSPSATAPLVAYDSDQSLSDDELSVAPIEAAVSPSSVATAHETELSRDVTNVVDELVTNVARVVQTALFTTAFPPAQLRRCRPFSTDDLMSFPSLLTHPLRHWRSLPCLSIALPVALEITPPGGASSWRVSGPDEGGESAHLTNSLDSSDDGIQILICAGSPSADEGGFGRPSQRATIVEHGNASFAETHGDHSSSASPVLGAGVTSAWTITDVSDSPVVTSSERGVASHLSVASRSPSHNDLRFEALTNSSVSELCGVSPALPVCSIPLTRLPSNPKQLRTMARRAYASDISRRIGQSVSCTNQGADATSQPAEPVSEELQTSPSATIKAPSASTDKKGATEIRLKRRPKKGVVAAQKRAQDDDKELVSNSSGRSKMASSSTDRDTVAEFGTKGAGAKKVKKVTSIAPSATETPMGRRVSFGPSPKVKKGRSDSHNAPSSLTASSVGQTPPGNRLQQTRRVERTVAKRRRTKEEAVLPAGDDAVAEPSVKRSKRSGRRERIASSSEESSSSDDSCEPEEAPETRRKKGDAETRARDYLMQHPDEMFPEAEFVVAALAAEGSDKQRKRAASDARARSKTIPVAYVPPCLAQDQERAVKSKKELRRIVREFVASTVTVLRLDAYKHFERLQIIRLLIALAYSGVRNVEPIIRLMAQNGRAEDDPLSMLATTLIPALIDTNHGTQANSAHLTVFHYLMPLFMQRWGLMTAGTSNAVQWRSLGQMLNNWNTYERWPELLIAAPREVAAFARDMLTRPDDVPPSVSCGSNAPKRRVKAFQSALARWFVATPAILARWCFLRRCAKAVNLDTSGHSLCMDLVVPPLAIWLRSISPVAVATACASADALALAPDPPDRIDHPPLAVYQAAMAVLSRALAGANSNVTYGRLVHQSFNANTDANPGGHTFDYFGTNPAFQSAAQTFTDYPPSSIDVSLDANAETQPALNVVYRWASLEPNESDAPSESELRVTIPLEEWPAIQAALVERSRTAETADPTDVPRPATPERPALAAVAAASSTSPLTAPLTPVVALQLFDELSARHLHLSGLRGTITEETIRALLTSFGEVEEVRYAEKEGKLSARFASSAAVVRAVLAIYATITRAECIHAVALNAPLLPAPAPVGRKAPKSQCTGTTRVFGGAPAAPDMATSLLLARPLGLESDAAYTDAVSVVASKVRAQQEQFLTSDTSTALAGVSSIATLRAVPYCEVNSKAHLRSALENGRIDVERALEAALREVVLAHLNANPNDSVQVTPPEWLQLERGVGAAAQPDLLYDSHGSILNVGLSRILLCPFLSNSLPCLAFIAFPHALDVFATKLTAPFVVIVGIGLSPAIEYKILLHLFVRLEAVLSISTAVSRPSVLSVKVPRAASSSDAGICETVLRIAHASQICLQLASSTDTLSMATEFFADSTLFGGFKTLMKTWADDRHDATTTPVLLAEYAARLLDQRRALARLGENGKRLRWRTALVTDVYTAYLAHRYLRAQGHSEWTSLKVVAELVGTDAVKQAYEMVASELRVGGLAEQRAFFARIQQLNQRGWSVVGADGHKIEFCRKGTEHAQLHLLDFVLLKDEKAYADEEERSSMKVGWGAPPIADY